MKRYNPNRQIKARSRALPHLCWSTAGNLLAGFGPMWLRARAAGSSLVETQHQIFMVKMQSSLASAAIESVCVLAHGPSLLRVL
jgi:hypothetical protein